jgi:protein-S-isoprenylcysteine O-methyltransferase Ste14
MTADLLHLLHEKPDRLFLFACIFIVMCCTVAVLAAVAVDFMQFNRREGVSKEKKSVVETGTMMLFFFLFYIALRSGAGTIALPSTGLRMALAAAGTLAVVAGCIVNIRGRLDLGRNWSNQIRIYKDHALVTGGVYALVRHPLYASLIWMFTGASLLYLNLLALLATLIIFVPFMYFRAKQEEWMLENEFEGYGAYRKEVGMFLPKPKF